MSLFLERRTAVVLTLTSCLLWSAVAAGGATPVESPEALLWKVRQAHFTGDFESAWKYHTSFLQHPARNDVNYVIFAHCFLGFQCPSYGLLSAWLGVGRSEFEKIGKFCPQWSRIKREIQIDPKGDVRKFPMLRDQLIRATFKGGCEDWRDRVLKLLHPLTILRTPPPKQTLPLTFSDAIGGGITTWVELDIEGQTVQALVDTGASFTTFNGLGSIHRFSLQDLEVLWVQPVRTFLGPEQMSLVRLPQLALGKAEFKHSLALLSRSNGSFNGVALGMNVLLRHESVCFDWAGRRLYLGSLVSQQVIK